MSVFRFKRFSIANERSAMKVNTDGVLLGAFAAAGLSPELHTPFRVLDAGTGTGTIALMLAQKLSALTSDFEIIGADTDKPSAEEAALNFVSSPWAQQLKAIQWSFSSCPGVFSLIVSNPPYFENALQAPEQRRCSSRHAATLSFRSLLNYSSSHLCSDGSVSLILPFNQETDLLRHAGSLGLFPKRLTRVHTIAGKEPSRILAEFSFEKSGYCEEDLVIHEGGEYSQAYRELVQDYYLWA